MKVLTPSVLAGDRNPGGADTQVQFNNGGNLSGSADLTWDDTGKELGVGGDINLDDGGTYATTLQLITPTANRTISFPDATGTVGLVGGSSGQLVYNNAGAYAGAPSTSVGASGDITLSLAGAASTPPVSLTGTWFSGGTSTTTKPQLLIEPTGTTSTAWSTDGTGLGVNAASGFTGRLFDFQVNGSSQAVLTGAGRLGVGTTSPTVPLFVNGEIYAKASSGGDNDYGVAICSGPSLANANAHKIRAGGGIGQLLIIETQTAGGNGQTLFLTNGSERARIDSSGRLLVGTSTSAASKQLIFQNSSEDALTIRVQSSSYPYNWINLDRELAGGTAVVSGANIGTISFRGWDGSNAIPGASIGANVDGTPGADDMPGRLVFSTTADGASSPTERMRISSDGTFSSYGSNGNFTVRSGVSGAADTAFIVRNGAGSNTTGALVARIMGDGDLENTNNSYGGISDIKLKENIVDANSQWPDIKALQVRNYNFKSETGYGTHTQIGLIAQEVELVSPGLVSESPDRDEEGNDLGTVTKSVNYSVLYMKAVKALQEAMERIETLEAKVAALESA